MRIFSYLLALNLCFTIIGCGSVGDSLPAPNSEQALHKPLVEAPANFDAALRTVQSAQAGNKIPPDIALFNTGIILAHPANPKNDYRRALGSFKTLVSEFPKSALVEQSKIWIQVIEQQLKLIDERQKLAEDKRALVREREALLRERQKQNYTTEKSRQLDLEIENRRRQSLSK